MDRGRRSHVRAALFVAAALVVMTCAYTWPLSLTLRTTVAHDRGDPLLVTWILWWSTQAVPLTTAWWNAPAFYPATGVFGFSEHLLGLAPISVPIMAVAKSPVLAYNAAFLLSYVFSGLAAYWLAFVVTRQHWASLVGGVAFAFAPYRLSHENHLQLLSSYWMPVSVAALHLYNDRPAWRWAALFGASWLMQALACGYYFFFLSLFAVVWIAFAAVRRGMRSWRPLAVCWLVAICCIAPILIGYARIHSRYGFKRSGVEIARYSADVAGIVTASEDSLLWNGLHFTSNAESMLFPGITLPVIIGVGLARRVRAGSSDASQRWFYFYCGAAALMWTLALGPHPHVFDKAIGVPGLYLPVMHLPGFDGIRVPARFWMVSVLCLGTAAAVVVSRSGGPATRRLVAACAVAGLLLDGWPRSFAAVPVPEMRVTGSQAAARLGLPLQQNETETMYGAIAQKRPVFNGYSGYEAPQYASLRYLLEAHDPRILDRLAASAPIEILVQRQLDPAGDWSRWVASRPNAREADRNPEWVSFTMAPTGAVAASPSIGHAIPISFISSSANAHDIGAVLDGDIDTRWWAPQQGDETITVSLTRAQRVGCVVMSLGTYASQFPRDLELSVSGDGVIWHHVSRGSTALAAYDAAIRDPRRIPIVLPVERDGVRYLRLHQLSRSPSAGWTIVELAVLG